MELFDAHSPRLHRYLTHLSGDGELAADLTQEAFLRLYRRGRLPDRPEAWLVTVSLNLFRNARRTRGRRRARLGRARAEAAHSDPAPSPGEAAAAAEGTELVRRALDRLEVRERELLLLRAEGYRYREIAEALELNEASVGTLLARARRSFHQAYRRVVHAPRR